METSTKVIHKNASQDFYKANEYSLQNVCIKMLDSFITIRFKQNL